MANTNTRGKPIISIIVCTYNRCSDLKEALESLSTQVYDESFDYEIIVIDNNSKDQTKEIVEDFIPKFNGNLRYFFELKQGLSNARNRGIKEALGEIIAYTDDDCIIEREWILNIGLTFKKYNADLVGGKSLPVWPYAPPKWVFRKYILGKLSLLDYGDEEFQITTKNKELYGCNIAFKKSELVKSGSFNESLGRMGNTLLAGEETEIFLKFLENSKKIYYQPKAIVNHKILPERMKKKFFRKRCFDGGRTTVRFQKNISIQEQKKIKDISLFNEIVVSILDWFKSVIFLNSERIFLSELNLAHLFGQTYEKVYQKIIIIKNNLYL